MKNHLLILSTLVIGVWSCETKGRSTSIDINKVAVEGGWISGSATADDSIQVFKGIPFAAPPTGDLRWKRPAPVAAWEGVKNCNEFGPSAMQGSPQPFYMWSEEFLIPKEPIDEDCLYLNVWTPAKTTNERRPVVVWIHGGGFVSGSGSVPIYDGEAMARKGVVFVSINYRVGIFGFFAHPELTKESADRASGNYGLMDQIAALQWVQRNIEAFGGDSQNVTIAGQSAGGASVIYLGASPLASGLFRKAIVQSGAGFLPRSPGGLSLTLEQAEQAGVEAGRSLEANSLAELRTLPASKLQQLSFRALPAVDGYVLPESAKATYEAGKANDFSLLVGWNEDDGIVIGGFQSSEDYQKGITNQWGTAGQQLLRHYPAPDDSTAAISQKLLQRDLVFGAPCYALANILSGLDKEVFAYRFTRRVPPGNYQEFGAFHTAEVPYAYNNLAFFDRPFEPTDHQLADIMSSYWVNFIRSGDPNSNDLPEWPQYDADGKEIMYLGAEQRKGVIEDAASLDFLVRELSTSSP